MTPEEKEEQIEIMAQAMRRSQNSPTQQEQFDRGYRAPKLPEEFVECISPSGATFTAVIVASKTYPAGRVVRLTNYLYPSNDILRMIGTHACVEGPQTWDWPVGMTVVDEVTHKLTPEANQLLAVQTWKRDLKEYVSKPLDVTIRVDRQKDLQKFRAQQDAETKQALTKSAKP